LEGRWRVGVEGDEIPEWLRFIFAQVRESGGVGIGMAGDIFANSTVGMTSETLKSFGVGAGMLADEAKKVKIFSGRLLGKFFEHFGLGFSGKNETDFFVPGGVDVIEFAGAGVNEFFEHAAFLLHTGDREAGAFKGIQNAEKMLTLTKDDLGSAVNAAIFFFFVLD
jgi:hypothetical protein